MDNIMERFTGITEWVYFLLVVQILWLIGVIVGAVVIGLIPSTVAVFALARQRIQGEDVKLNKEFWKFYKENLFKVQLQGYIWVVFGIFLYYDIRLLFSFQQIATSIIAAILVSMLILYLLSSMLILPIKVHYNLSVLNEIRLPLFISVTMPYIAIGLISSTIVLYFIATYIPILFALTGVSLTAILYTKCSFFAFEKLQKTGFLRVEDNSV